MTKKSTFSEIEKKFDDTAFRLTQERNDFFLPQIVDFVRSKKWINLQPEYQRRLVWDNGKKSRFIESLLLNVPVPPVFLYEWDLGRYEVMDGQQRLNAVVAFYKNEFRLSGLEHWKELSGFSYGELPDTLQRGLDRRRLSATVLLVERRQAESIDKTDIRKLVFNRLNTGGQQLNAQELRNCLYDSPFNKLLISLSQKPEFQKAWDIPLSKEHTDSKGNPSKELMENPLYKRMIDCEIVLRFFAFRQKSLRGSVKSILDRYMESGMKFSPSRLEELSERFETRLSACCKIFEAEVFRYKHEGQWRHSQPLYDAVMIAVDRLWDNVPDLKKQKSKAKRAIKDLLEDEDAYEVVVGRPNTAKALKERLDKVEAALATVLAA